jgi:energy-coupling factor transporter ATP-binding protein EcfA2
MGLLARLCREQGKTVVMIGHDLTWRTVSPPTPCC